MHVHISALHAVEFLLTAVVTIGSVNLWSRTHPDNRISRAMDLLF